MAENARAQARGNGLDTTKSAHALKTTACVTSRCVGTARSIEMTSRPVIDSMATTFVVMLMAP